MGCSTPLHQICNVCGCHLEWLRDFQDEQIGRKVSPYSEGKGCKQFSLVEILTATKIFDDALIIGRRGFDNVYKGQIQGIQYEVAIKRLNSMSHQGENEFWAEFVMLS